MREKILGTNQPEKGPQTIPKTHTPQSKSRIHNSPLQILWPSRREPPTHPNTRCPAFRSHRHHHSRRLRSRHQVCFKVPSQVSLSRADILFSAGEEGKSMSRGVLRPSVGCRTGVSREAAWVRSRGEGVEWRLRWLQKIHLERGDPVSDIVRCRSPVFISLHQKMYCLVLTFFLTPRLLCMLSLLRALLCSLPLEHADAHCCFSWQALVSGICHAMKSLTASKDNSCQPLT